MKQPNQQNQGRNGGQTEHTEEKKDLQKTNKSGGSHGSDHQDDQQGKTGKYEHKDIDERTNAEQRGGDPVSGAQKHASSDKSGIGRQQHDDVNSDPDIEADNSMQPGRTAHTDKNSQKNTDASKDSKHQADHNKGNKSSK